MEGGRTHESAMDWEYQNKGPLDPTSPFTTFSQTSQQLHQQQNRNGSIFSSPRRPSAFSSQQPRNPFGARSVNPIPAKSTSIFNPEFQRNHTAKPFANPSFTTPRKPFDEAVFSEMSGCESSPALTEEASELPLDSPDARHETMTPAKMNKAFASAKASGLMGRNNHASGRGEIPRGKNSFVDKVRKRRRNNDDRDVATVRYRIESEISDSDSDDMDVEPRRPRGRSVVGRKNSRKQHKRGWFGNMLSTVTMNPTAPDILGRWLVFVVQSVAMVIVVYFLWTMVVSIKRDMNLATEKARSERLGNITECSRHWLENKCNPREHRAPALAKSCDEWEVCMNQDPSEVHAISVGVRQFAELLNEFVSTMHLKTMGFLGGIVFLAIIASRSGSGRQYPTAHPHQAANSSPQKVSSGAPFQFTAPPTDPDRAYIWAPLSATPHRKGRPILDDGTDTDVSPPVSRHIMAAPDTPSGRRSPSKEYRRSPMKMLRSPSKGY